VADLKHLGDTELVGLVANGDKQALEAVYERYGQIVFSMARAMLRDVAKAEEVTQDTFLSLWKKASTYTVQRGSLYTWLMSVAHHRTVDELRRRRRTSKDDMSLEANYLDGYISIKTEETERLIEQNWREGQIRQVLLALPEEQRRVVIMAYFEGYTHSQIARRLNQPLGTVKTRLRLALQKLRVALQPEEVV
jgi:RNA polymerase sigma-70 factor (ECF subfamily)